MNRDPFPRWEPLSGWAGWNGWGSAKRRKALRSNGGLTFARALAG